MVNLHLQALSFLYMILVIVVFYTKENIKNMETNIYESLLWVNIAGIILDIVLVFYGYYNPYHYMAYFLNKCYMTYIVLWATIFSFYIFKISLTASQSKKYSSIINVIYFLATILEICLLFALDVKLYNQNGVMYSYGSSITSATIYAFVHVIAIVFIIIKNRKNLTIKNLLLNKKRTIVTIIGIMLSVALITAVSSMSASGIKSLEEYEKSINGTFHVVFYNVDEKGVNEIKQNRVIKDIYYIKNIGYAKIDSKNEYKPYARIIGINKESMSNLSLRLVEGRFPENGNEIVIPTHLKTNGRINYKVGDEIELNIGKRSSEEKKVEGFSTYIEGEELVDTYSKKYKIVGIINRPAYNVEQFDEPGFSFITILDENDISSNVDMYIKFSKNGLKRYDKVISDILGVKEESFNLLFNSQIFESEDEYEEAIKDFTNAKYVINLNKYLIDLQVNPIKNNTVGDLSKLVIVICLIIVFTSVFCIKNSFDISITEKTKQYGMLRSVGATKKQIRKNVFYEATILGITGIILGIFLGLLATFILVIVCNYYFKNMGETFKLVFSLNYIAIIISIVLGIVTIYLSAIKSAYTASKVSPIESIRNSADIKIKSKKISSPKIINKIFGVGGEISYKNLKRNKKKYRTTTISLVISVSIFIALSYFMSLAISVINDEVNTMDYDIALGCDHTKECEVKALQTINLEGVEKYSLYKQDSIFLTEHKVNKEVEKLYSGELNYTDEETGEEISRSEYDSLAVISLGDEEYRRYIKKLNISYESVKDKAILLDILKFKYVDEDNETKQGTFEIYTYHKGDKINYYITNEKDKNSIEVIKTTDVVPFGLKQYIESPFSSVIILSDSKYEELFKDSVLKNIYYKTDNPDKLQDDIEKILSDYDVYIDNPSEKVKQMKNLCTLAGIFLYGFIIVITLIGVTNIFNTITTSVYLRKREFATLKSIGMTTKEFNKMIRLESIFMGVKSLLFSIPIGLILSYLIYNTLGKDMGVLYHIPFKPIIISICAVFLLIALIMKYSVSKVNKQNIIETIRNENI